jgi:hypothetical protein
VVGVLHECQNIMAQRRVARDETLLGASSGVRTSSQKMDASESTARGSHGGPCVDRHGFRGNLAETQPMLTAAQLFTL